MEHWYEVGLVLHGKSLDCMFRANRKKLEGSQKKSIISDLHLKKITLAALWEKVSKRQQQKRRISSPELILLCDVLRETTKGSGVGLGVVRGERGWGRARRGLSAAPIKTLQPVQIIQSHHTV